MHREVPSRANSPGLPHSPTPSPEHGGASGPGDSGWRSLAIYLSEESTQPTLALDRDGRVQLFNGAFEKLTGWHRSQLIARPWVELGIHDAEVSRFLWRFEEAFRGEIRQDLWEIQAIDGRPLSLQCTLSRIGKGNGVFLLVQVTGAAPSRRDDHPAPANERRGEITCTPESFGKLLYSWAAEGQAASDHIGHSCYKAFYGREEPCEGCPVFEQTVYDQVIEIIPTPVPDDDGLLLLWASRVGDDRLFLSERHIGLQLFSKLVQTRLGQVADRCNLSTREGEVLSYLAMGRSYDDIGKILNISVRTVKFHLSNILAKIGADSRLDLFRIILFS